MIIPFKALSRARRHWHLRSCATKLSDDLESERGERSAPWRNHRAEATGAIALSASHLQYLQNPTGKTPRNATAQLLFASSIERCPKAGRSLQTITPKKLEDACLFFSPHVAKARFSLSLPSAAPCGILDLPRICTQRILLPPARHIFMIWFRQPPPYMHALNYLRSALSQHAIEDCYC